ncbi:MAG: hypothetical protein WKF89_08780 [Chitinophagaceae bacterium]
MLSGQVGVEVEDRRYNLSPLDNVTIPAGYAHSVKNSSHLKAVFHIAMTVDQPQRTLVAQQHAALKVFRG